MGLDARLRALEALTLPSYCSHQSVWVTVPPDCTWEPPTPRPRRCWCGLEPLHIAITYTDGPAPWEPPL